MSAITDSVSEAVEKTGQSSDSRLNAVIAAMVAVLATIMAVFNIKDGNIVQAMAQARVNGVDAWNYFQAKSLKQTLAENVLDQLMIEREGGAAASPEASALLEQKIAVYREKARAYAAEKEEIEKQARGFERDYDRLNLQDDQLDSAEAGITIAISLLGISALTRKKWLVGLALVFGSLGIVLGVAGFAGWNLHPGVVARWLG